MLLLSFLLHQIFCEGQNTSVKIRTYTDDSIFLALDDKEIAMADENNAKSTFIVSISSNSTEDKPMYRIKSLTSTGYMLGRDDAGKLISTKDPNAANVDWEIILDPTESFEIIRNGETCLTFHTDSFHLEQCAGDYANPPNTQKFAVLTGEQKPKEPKAAPPTTTTTTTSEENAPTKTTNTLDEENTVAAPPVHTITESISNIPESGAEGDKTTLPGSTATGDANTKQGSTQTDAAKSQTDTNSVTVSVVSQPGGKTEQLVTNEVKKDVITTSTTNVTQTSTETSTTQVVITTLTKVIESKTQLTRTITDTVNVTETCTATKYKTEMVQIPIAKFPNKDGDQNIKEKVTCDDGTEEIIEKEPKEREECEDAKTNKHKKHHNGKPKKKNMFTEAINNISKFVNGSEEKKKSYDDDSDASDSSSMYNSECEEVIDQQNQMSDLDALSDVVCELNKLGDFDKNGVMASGIDVPEIFRPRQVMAEKKKIIKRKKKQPSFEKKPVKIENGQGNIPNQFPQQQTPVQVNWQPYIQPTVQPPMMQQPQPFPQQIQQYQPQNQKNEVKSMVCNPITPAC
ncbi:hypothetical protein BDAP_001661 [Binucleata daphniae]